MAAISLTPILLRPLQGAVLMRIEAGAAGNVGDVVYIDSNNKAQAALADAVGTSRGKGMVIRVGVVGATSFVAGDMLEVVTHGPITVGEVKFTPGVELFLSAATAGALDETATAVSTEVPYVCAWALSDSILYVEPQTAAPVANV